MSTFVNTGFFAPFKIPIDKTFNSEGSLIVSSNKLDRTIKSIKQPKKRKVIQMRKTENSLNKIMHDAAMYQNALFVPQSESSRTANKRKNKRK